MLDIGEKAALVVIDVQKGFDEESWWGKRNNPACEANIGLLLDVWESTGRPIVLVRHDSTSEGSPLRPENLGNGFKAQIEGRNHDVLVIKSVHSSFHGKTDLHAWLKDRGISQLVISGIATNICCETTTRVAGDLGYDVLFAVDATHAFDKKGPDGRVVTADDFTRTTVATLDGEFARVVRTADVVASVRARKATVD